MSFTTRPHQTPVQLLRRWVVDYFNSHDRSVAHEFILPSYQLEIGDYLFVGRDDQWLPAVDQQMQAFPGMGMTVHQVVSTQDRVAVYFSEHGASKGRQAVWSGVGIYSSNGQHLTNCIAQEDYMTRQRQLKSGVCDPVEAPAVSPWDTEPMPANLLAEAVVRDWLMQSWPPNNQAIRCDDEHLTGEPLSFKVQSNEFTAFFSSGDDVAFHVRQTGLYSGGFAGITASPQNEVLNVNGVLRVQNSQVVSGRIIRDRSGLKARLQKDLKP
jgi:predicted ester cyclase